MSNDDIDGLSDDDSNNHRSKQNMFSSFSYFDYDEENTRNSSGNAKKVGEQSFMKEIGDILNKSRQKEMKEGAQSRRAARSDDSGQEDKASFDSDEDINNIKKKKLPLKVCNMYN